MSSLPCRPIREQGGAGLGLSIARRLVQLHGGNMHVSSLPGQGSTFGFTLPLWVDSAAGESCLVYGRGRPGRQGAGASPVRL